MVPTSPSQRDQPSLSNTQYKERMRINSLCLTNPRAELKHKRETVHRIHLMVVGDLHFEKHSAVSIFHHQSCLLFAGVIAKQHHWARTEYLNTNIRTLCKSMIIIDKDSLHVIHVQSVQAKMVKRDKQFEPLVKWPCQTRIRMKNLSAHKRNMHTNMHTH